MDKTFMPKDGTPEIKACLMCPMEHPDKVFEHMASHGLAGTLYGLCNECIEMLERVPTYKDKIEAMIELRLIILQGH